MQPFKLNPAYKDYLWGGQKLKAEYGRRTPMSPLAESWELSAHPDGESTVADGPLAGATLSQLFARQSVLFGSHCAGMAAFPILIKLIDAMQPLSVQVHPDDAYAQKAASSPGKTEMWVVLDCEPGAYLYFGFERVIDKIEFEQRIADGTLAEVLHAAPVKKGDVFFVPAGTIHAIGAGLVIAEVQESSNLTYRVFDYGRTGANGKPRPLHIREALEVTHLGPASPAAPGAGKAQGTPGHTLAQLAKCPYFTVRRLDLHGDYHEALDGRSFVSLLCTDGEAQLAGDENATAITVQKGDSLFIPASLPGFTLQGQGGFLLPTV